MSSCMFTLQLAATEWPLNKNPHLLMQLTAVFLGIVCSTNHRSQTGWASLKLKETYIFTLQYSVGMSLYILVLFNYCSSTLAQAQHFDKMYVWDLLENCGGMSGDRIACLCKLYHLCSNTLHFPWQSISQGRKKSRNLWVWLFSQEVKMSFCISKNRGEPIKMSQ